jgi:membrane protease YdiL (CAAX protease family)
MYNESSSSIIVGSQPDSTSTTNATSNFLPPRYLVAAFSFSWVFWLFPVAAGQGWISWPWIASAKIPLILAGSFGPFVAAFALSLRSGGIRAMRHLASRALRFRIHIGILLLALFLLPALAALAIYLNVLGGGAPLAAQLSASQIPLVFIMMFFIGGAFQEEFGWAYAIDHMQRNRSTLFAAALLGIIWAFWHLPLFFIPGLTQTYMPFWSFLLITTFLRILFVWAYNATNHSILTALLFHTSLNFSLNLFPLIDRHDGVIQKSWLYFCLLTCIAVLPVIWHLWRGQRVHAGL